MTTPEVKEDFSVCTCTGRLHGGQKAREPHTITRVDMHPQASALGSILEKVVPTYWRGSKDQSGVKKETK